MGAKFARLMRAGWPVIPLSRDGKKTPLVSGYHGKDAAVADRETVKAWVASWPDCNAGVVMPPGVIGLDVDGPSHGGVNGLEALAAFEEKFGPLPETGRIFHGYVEVEGHMVPSPYGTRLYRIPSSMLDLFVPGSIVGNLTKVTGLPGVDVIAPWIRYNLAPGAVHGSGEVYEFTWSPEPGAAWLCKPSDLPELSESQVKGLLTRRSKARAKVETKPLEGPTAVPAASQTGRGILAQTRALAGLKEGETLLIHGEERGWQRGDGFYVLACDLVRAALAAGKSLDKVGAQFAEAAGEYDDAERQWENAVASVTFEEEERQAGAYPFGVNVETYRFSEVMVDREFRDSSGTLTLRFGHEDETFWLWSAAKGRYEHLSDTEMKAIIARILKGAVETSPDGEIRPVKVRPRTYAEVVECLRSITLTSPHGGGSLLPCVGGVPFANGWLDVESGELEPIGPERDVRWNVPADYDPSARCTEWFKFLDSISWVKGSAERRLLRQWFGYLISGETDIHKGVLLVGPKRAGKGTILSIAEALLGAGAAGIQLDAFGSNFGMQNLIGKGLAIVGDARFSFRTDKAIIEKLLSLTSFDPMQIDVKYGKPLNVRLGTRLMVATNEIPKFIEASDALATRFLILEFTESFYGREDLSLKKRILAELPGIARWALGGYRELRGLGSFSETDAGLRLQTQMIMDAAPIRVFVEDECVVDPTASVESQRLFDEYLLWAKRNRMFELDRSAFFRDLNTALPGKIKDYYKRVNGQQVKSKKGIRLR